MADKDEAGEGILHEAKERFAACESYYSTEYERGRESTRFVYGEQWDEAALAARKGRPCLVENRVLSFKHQVLNETKQANLTIKVSPVDDKADVKTAEIRQGIIRNIEIQSNASVAYDTAADTAITFGRGYIRIITEYADFDSFNKEIRIKRVLNPESVYIDPHSTEMDGSDAEFAFVFDDLSTEEFERLYPDAEPVSYENGAETAGWCTNDTVRVAEYFYKDYETKTLCLLMDNTTAFKADLPEGYKDTDIVDTREVQIPVIRWCKLSGAEVLEETTFEGIYIPIIPVYGEEAWLDGRRQVFDLIHQGKDPQRALNYSLSASTEVLALQPKAPFVGPVGSFKSKLQKWLNANNANPAFLEYDPVIIETESGPMMAPAPTREMPPQGSQALFQMYLSAGDAIKAVLGMYDPSLGNQSNEVSGIAIGKRTDQGDRANFHFKDNLSISICHVGRVLNDLIGRIHTKAQIMRIIGVDGSKENVPVNQPFMKTDQGLVPYDGQADAYDGIYDLKAGKYDVVVEVGPGYSTKRKELVDTILALTGQNPALFGVIGDILVKNLDIPDSEELVRRLQATMDPALLGDNPQAAKLLALAEQLQAKDQELLSLQIQLDEKLKNQQFENELKLKELESENTQFQITAKQKDKEIELKAMEVAAKVQPAMPGAIPPEVIAEIGGTLDEILGRLDAVEGAAEAIVSAKEQEATSQPRGGILSRLMGRNS